MSDLVGNHIVGFPMRRLIYTCKSVFAAVYANRDQLLNPKTVHVAKVRDKAECPFKGQLYADQF